MRREVDEPQTAPVGIQSLEERQHDADPRTRDVIELGEVEGDRSARVAKGSKPIVFVGKTMTYTRAA